MAKLSQSSQMIRVSNEIIELIPELNRLAREGRPIADLLQGVIDRLSQDEPTEGTEAVDINSTPASDPDSSPAPDPGLLEILAKLAQMEQKIDRLSQQPQAQAAPAEILRTNELMQKFGIPFAQVAAQGRNSGQPLEAILAQRTGYRHLGNGTFARQ